MHKIYRVALVLLAAVVLLTACGKKGGSSKDSDKKGGTTGASINYEDYITPVVDRKITDCISVEQINRLFDELLLPYDMIENPYHNDSTVNYYSEDGRTITLTLENMTREYFDTNVVSVYSDLIALENLGEVAYWNGDQTELIAYQNGYAFSMSVQNIANAAMIGMTEIVMESLSE